MILQIAVLWCPQLLIVHLLVVSVASMELRLFYHEQIRTQLKRSIPHGMGKLLSFSGLWRKQVKEKFPIPMNAVSFGRICMPVR